MTIFYDRSFKIPAWVVLNLEGKKLEGVKEALESNGAYFLPWPSQTFKDTLAVMGKNGWHHVVGKPMPYLLEVNFLSTAAAKHVKAALGPTSLLSGSNIKPYRSIDRMVKTEDDIRRIFDELLDSEDDPGLSQVFGTGERKAAVYVSEGPVSNKVISRLTNNLLTVGENEDSMVNSKGKKIADIAKEIDDLINARLGLS